MYAAIGILALAVLSWIAVESLFKLIASIIDMLEEGENHKK